MPPGWFALNIFHRAAINIITRANTTVEKKNPKPNNKPWYFHRTPLVKLILVANI